MATHKKPGGDETPPGWNLKKCREILAAASCKEEAGSEQAKQGAAGFGDGGDPKVLNFCRRQRAIEDGEVVDKTVETVVASVALGSNGDDSVESVESLGAVGGVGEGSINPDFHGAGGIALEDKVLPRAGDGSSCCQSLGQRSTAPRLVEVDCSVNPWCVGLETPVVG